MSIWNSVMQACHSALIDELSVQFPQDKLELGLPTRMGCWATTPETDLHLLQALVTPEGPGMLILGTRHSPSSKEKDPRVIFTRTLERAQKEFSTREIDARLGEEKFSELGSEPLLRMIIWLPIRILGKTTPEIFDLGVGI